MKVIRILLFVFGLTWEALGDIRLPLEYLWMALSFFNLYCNLHVFYNFAPVLYFPVLILHECCSLFLGNQNLVIFSGILLHAIFILYYTLY